MAMKCRYQVVFDLNTSKAFEILLKAKYNKSLSTMYAIIKKYLFDNGFEWVEGSTYHSINEITYNELSDIIKRLYRNNLWLSFFTRDMKITKVEDVNYNFNDTLNYYKKRLKNKEHQEVEKREKAQQKTQSQGFAR